MWKKVKKGIRNNWPIGILFFVSTIIYYKWLSFDIFLNGDWGFYFSETARDFFQYSAWESRASLGSPSIVLWMWAPHLLSGFWGLLGFDSNVAEKFLILWPFVFLAPTFSYLLAKEVLKNNWGALVGACVFSFNTYYLAINTQGHVLLSVAGTFAPLALLFYWRYFNDGGIKNLIASALSTIFIGAYDFRVMYVLFFILLALPIWKALAQKGGEQKKTFFRQNIWPLVLFFGLLFLLNIFWVWPTVMTGSLLDNEAVGRSLVANNYHLDLEKSLTLLHPFWNGSEPAWFHSKPVPFHFWLIPVMIVIAVFWARKDRKILFWFAVALVSIFLSKQDARPLVGIYPWLHEHFPGFNAFREASKFYFAIALSYAILIGYFVKHAIEAHSIKNKTKYAIIFLTVGLFLWNTKPILTGEMYKIFTPKEIPKNDLVIRENILKQGPFYRTLLVTEGSKFVTFSNAHPVMAATSLRKSQWEKIFDFGKIQGDELGGSEKVRTFLSRSYATNALSQSSFASFVVSEKDFLKVSELVKNPAWKEFALGIAETRFFKNNAVKPRIYLTEERETIHRNISFQKIDFSSKNPSRWHLSLAELKDKTWINFSENYHPNWRLACGDFRWYDTFFSAKIFSDENHHKTDAGLNAFQVNQAEWQAVCGGKGVHNAELSLFYLPQAYLYLGGIITLMTVLFSLVTLVFWKEKSDNAKYA